MNSLKDSIKSLASEYLQEVTDIRRHLHRHPELSFKEFETAKFIAEKLTEYGIPFQDKVARTGIVALIKGKDPESRVVALRADMDALPIKEKSDADYCSVNEGVMHACGHDAHMASLLGAAKILNDISDHFNGTVKLIFQPSEEYYPGGAKVMIEEGVLENPKPDAIFGQHVFPELDIGKIGMRPGKYMASTDEVYITVKGKGGHAAIPDKVIDPVLIASHIVIALQQIVSRKSSPVMPTVVSFGKISSEGKTNIIPDEVKLEGIIRTFSESWRKEIKEQIINISCGLAESMGASCEINIEQGYPAVVNDDDLTERAWNYATEYLGHDQVEKLEMRMTAEDFSYFAQKVPGCFYRLGTRNEIKGITANLHAATFDIDESSLENGMGILAWFAVCELNVK
ncbi:MAG: amidohydrolase [Bacteroidales bacterium]|nr:amidohydrolase [Bacteroidales bacterium]MCK5338420.1 amidohydrolase [Bacteroidales bacterium]